MKHPLNHWVLHLKFETKERYRIKLIYLSNENGSTTRVVGVVLENILTREELFEPLSYLGLSLGPTASFEYEKSNKLLKKIQDYTKIRSPVPYQTIATGFSAQLLFKITNKDKFHVLPHTGLKQTHFVEIARTDQYVIVKLTAGGMIGLPVYSRSYAINAIANMLRVLTPDTGLEFFDVICAWPCTRGINRTNNGQLVLIADNAAIRFGEGGTGISKMGTNAQTILDSIGIINCLPADLQLPGELYKHTVIDHKKKIAKRLDLNC